MGHSRKYLYKNSRNYKYDGVTIKKEKVEKMTSLILAVKMSIIEIIKLLLSNKDIDVNAQYILSDKYESTKIAKKAELPEWSEEELDIINNRSNNIKKTALHIAIENENVEIIKLLLKNKNIDINNICKYSKSTEFYDPGEGTFRSESKYTSKKEEKAPLIIAIEKENIEIIKLLLSNKSIDVNMPYVVNEIIKLL